LESELFGHMKGSFTGAHRDKIGKFEAANHGTVFLDEISTMPIQLQSKLLRVLQEQEVERIGSTRPIKIDIRVIAASNQDLEEEVKKGTFREDLYYRLNVIPLHIPPLRERVTDILPLARHFMTKYCAEMGRPLMTTGKDSLEALEQYDWPGNVRELENLVERLVALTDGDQVTLQDLPANISKAYGHRELLAPRVTEQGIDLPETVNEIERQMIAEALALTDGVKTRAAALLHLNRTTLVEKMRRFGMSS
ncbi:MAG TPA: sigma-54 dependent transcriptional regulator, partial [Geobacteraceae bacterium]